MDIAFGEDVFRKYKCIRKLKDSTFEVLGSDIQVVKIIDIPVNQSDIFDLLMKDMNMASIEEHYKKEADRITKQLERFAYLKEDSHIFKHDEFEVSKIPGGTGWRIKILKDKMVTLEEYRKVHDMTKSELIKLGLDLCDALIEGLNAGCHHGHICMENIYISPKDHFLLDDFSIRESNDMMDLQKLLSQLGLDVPCEEDPWKMKECIYEIQ